jgi:hypothetical protein
MQNQKKSLSLRLTFFRGSGTDIPAFYRIIEIVVPVT